jgi:hypothetical protein
MEIKIKKAGSHDGGDSEFIRQFKARPVIFVGTIIILLIVVVAFVFVPVFVPEARGGGGSLIFGTWNKKPISYVPGNYFAQRQRELAQYMQNSLTEENYPMISRYIWQQAFDDAVIHTAILDAMLSAGYAAPAETVDRQVAQLPDFQENGRFSPARWNRLDSTTRLNIWRDIQDSIGINHYIEDVTGLKIPPGEADFIAHMGERRRSFDLAAFSLSSWPEGELAAYAEENAGLFVTTHLSRITVSSNEREAAQIRTSIQDGVTGFEDAAKLHSQDIYADRGGDLGLKMVYELFTELENPADREQVAALKTGEYSPIIKIEDSWTFFRAETDPYPADITDSATAAKIRFYVMDFERGRVEDWVIADAALFIESVRNNGLRQAAFFRGIEIRSFGPLPLNYGARSHSSRGFESDGVDLFPSLASFSIDELYSAGNQEIFWKTAFSTPLNEPSAPFVIGNNVLILVPTAEETADEEVLAGIRETYSSYWVSNSVEQSLQTLFFASDKLVDRFETVYRQNVGL